MTEGIIRVAWSLLGALAVSGAARAEEPPRASGAQRQGGAKAPEAKVPEVAEMAAAILVHGADMGPGVGWFHPGRGRHGWDWLAARYDADRDGAIFAREFTGPAELFDRLDRDRDGAVTADDLDWSAQSAYARQYGWAGRQFSLTDRDNNGKVTKAEWDALFERAAKGRPFLIAEDLRRAVPMAPPRRPPGEPEESDPSDEPTRRVLLKGLLNGEVGSHHEGPSVGDPAPDFALATHDGKRLVALGEVLRAKKPVVLIFGSFT